MGQYDDMIYLPHHQSQTRAHMSLHDRAAQFAPFAALTGYGAAIHETARLTESRIELTESEKADLDLRLQMLTDHLSDHPEITVTYFLPDERKDGGAYVDHKGIVKRLDTYERLIVMKDGTLIPIEDVCHIESPLFRTLDDGF
ncbi:MAG: hypothetical protein Q3985_04165 [Eubacteriales bacterium]|nr:hypothetical protein [Eubacteriales bacterium]